MLGGLVHRSTRRALPPPAIIAGAVALVLLLGYSSPAGATISKGRMDCAGPSCGTWLAFGWAYDPDASSSSLSIHFYIDGKFAGAKTANLYRSDVNAAFGITGSHGFAWSIPSKYRTGSHQIRAYAIDTNGNGNPQLSNSPLNFSYSPPPPVGYLDCAGAHCSSGWRVAGWAYDPSSSSTSVNVELYLDAPRGSGRYMGRYLANRYRSDVNAAMGISGYHGFSVSIPTAYRTPGRRVYAYVIGVGGGVAGLASSPKNMSGTVSYTISGNALIGGVTVSAGGRSATSAADGSFTITGVPGGTHSVSASKSGCAFTPTSVIANVGPSVSGLQFASPCAHAFPHGDTSYADDYINDYPYAAVFGQRWQHKSVPYNDGFCSAKRETCLSSSVNYPVYSTGYTSNDCDNSWPSQWCPALDDCFNCVEYPHPRVAIGTGKPIWMDGLLGTDTAGYGYCGSSYDCGSRACSASSSYCSFHGLVDKIIVADPLGSSARNTSCPSACGGWSPSSCPDWVCSDLGWARTDWGANARKVYPGEITPDFWGIVPIDDSTDFWQTMVAWGRQLGRATDVPGNGYILSQIAVHVPKLDNFWGGEGPACSASATHCELITNRAKAQLVGGKWVVTISGYLSSSDNVLDNTSDIAADLAALAGHTSSYNAHVTAIMGWINYQTERDSSFRWTLQGHSLGAMDAVVLHHAGFGGDGTVAYSPPTVMPSEALIGDYESPIVAYVGAYDLLSNYVNGLCLTCRAAMHTSAGVAVVEIYTGLGSSADDNPHARERYTAGRASAAVQYSFTPTFDW